MVSFPLASLSEKVKALNAVWHKLGCIYWIYFRNNRSSCEVLSGIGVYVCQCRCLGRVMTCMQLQSSCLSGSEDQDHFKEDCRWSNAKSKLLSQKSVTSVTAKNKQKLPFQAHHISLFILTCLRFAKYKNKKVFTCKCTQVYSTSWDLVTDHIINCNRSGS